METVVWICQGLLSFVFLYSGIHKSVFPEEKLVKSGQTGVEGLHPFLIKFIGITEIAGAVGIVVPWVLNIYSVLTPLSAAGFCVIMMLAAPVHFRRGEYGNVVINVVLFLLSLFVAYQRFAGLN